MSSNRQPQITNARWYDAGLARFTQPDSIVPGFANPQSLNRYSYVYNNPIMMVDPSGNFATNGQSCYGDDDNGQTCGGALMDGIWAPQEYWLYALVGWNNHKDILIYDREFREREKAIAEANENIIKALKDIFWSLDIPTRPCIGRQEWFWVDRIPQ